MFKKINIVSVLVFCLVLTTFGEDVAKIIAKVNKQVITSKDLDDYCKVLQLRLTEARADAPPEDGQFREMALQRLIEDMLILGEAKRMKLEIPRAVIDKRLNKLINSYPSRKAFEESLQERGFSLTRLKEKIREQYLMQEFIQMQVKSSISISPQEISTYYIENKTKMLSPVVYIFYIASSQEEGKLKAIAGKIKQEGIAAAKDSFSELTKLESSKDELNEEMADSLDTLLESEFKIIKIDQLQYLVYLDKKLKSRLLKLQETKEQIREYLWDLKFKQRFTDWINELKEAAVIRIYNG